MSHFHFDTSRCLALIHCEMKPLFWVEFRSEFLQVETQVYFYTVKTKEVGVLMVSLLGFTQLQCALMFNAFTVIIQRNLCCKFQLIQCKYAWTTSHCYKQTIDYRDFCNLGQKACMKCCSKEHPPLKRPHWQHLLSNLPQIQTSNASWALQALSAHEKEQSSFCVNPFYKSFLIQSSRKWEPWRQLVYAALSWTFQLSINKIRVRLAYLWERGNSKANVTVFN